ncbi:tetratricopeptide repeat protein [Inhella gelatinilytica]|uniref:Tetratricopeptide repeat protein n=1 Tax=Inhella gelatinilytica TaxID=2795030 RepID=A0A931J270_9BURK|nr:tetratricopeptide repeat protein [Inhella gelatinilytica]MBH9554123.1 tetratricopeptide repeat protein [Inhella gelatinilytica]
MRTPRHLFVASFLALGLSVAVPAQAQVSSEQAQSHWYAGRHELAVALLRAELDKQPQQPKLRFMLAWMLQERGLWADAEALLKQLIEDYPDHAEALNNLAVVLAQRGDLDGALLSLQRAVVLQPSNTQAQENLGDLLLRLAQRAYANAAKGNASRTLPVKADQLNGLLRTLSAL